jgi:hypothetical protein
MLHLPGSLANLAKSFCSDIQIEKGSFPHLFNRYENYDYVGEIPGLEYFDTSFCKTEQDYQDIITYHESWQGRTDWSFKDELKKYCDNDVLILANVIRKHNDICLEKFGIVPWKKATAPGYAHEYTLLGVTANLELCDRKEDEGKYLDECEKAAKTSWCALKPTEYWFARKALRGGRTNVNVLHYEMTPEQLSNGEFIMYQDVCSMYPFHQLTKQFPVGYPTIHIYDKKGYPCLKHENMKSCMCGCIRSDKGDRYCNFIHHDTQPTSSFYNDPSFFGFVLADILQPNLVHPVILQYDEEKKKCLSTCGIIEKCFCTTIELQRVIQRGGKVIKLYRYDEYKSGNQWRELMVPLYLAKMTSSNNEPTNEEKAFMLEQYALEEFDFADELEKTFDKGIWKKDPALKTVSKTVLNSLWGKHAERPNQPKTLCYDQDDSISEVRSFFDNVLAKKYQFLSGIHLGSGKSMYKYINNEDNIKPDIHKSYLPAACFVPAYGRLQIEEQLFQLGTRALMHDTDSIVYHYIPNEYNIPESTILGRWEAENKLKEFVGLGPKTYAAIKLDGKSIVKAKGISLKRATSNIVNFEEMKKVALDFIEKQGRGRTTRIQVNSTNSRSLKLASPMASHKA